MIMFVMIASYHTIFFVFLQSLNATEPEVQQAAEYAVTYINKLLYAVRDKCLELKLKKIFGARKAYPNEQVGY